MPEQKSNNVLTGQVVEFNYTLGYGTIQAQDKLIVFTYRNLPIKDGKFIVPQKGQIVEFQVEQDRFYGLIAKNIKIINQNNSQK